MEWHDRAVRPRRGYAFEVRRALVLLGSLALLGIDSTSVRAHDPIIITDEQTTPESGPFLPDGTISFALYGSVTTVGDTRSLRVQFAEGDRLHVSLLIPDLAPENTLGDDELPSLRLVGPGGELLELFPNRRVKFAEPFTGTNYVELVDHTDTAQAGIYLITVVGGGPARFTVSVGDKEIFGTPVEGVVDRSIGVGGVMEWYETAPVASNDTMAPTTTAPTTTAPTTSTPDSSTPVSTTASTRSPEGSSGATLPIVIVVSVVVLGLGVWLVRSRRKS